MGTDISTGTGNRSALYKAYRKFRYLKKRGTLFRKYPRQVRKKRKSPAWKFFHRLVFLTRKGAVGRILSYQNQLALSEKKHPQGYLGISKERSVPVVLTPATVPAHKISFRERRNRSIRKIRYVIARRKRVRKLNKVQKQKSFSTSYVTYRKVRYLIRTGKLFRFNIAALSRSVNRFLGHFGNAGMLTISINSTLIYLLAYLFVYLTKQFAIAAAARSFNIATLIYYFDIDFLIRSTQWGKDSVVVVYSAGPFVSLILAIFALIVYAGISHRNWQIRLFLLWVFCQGFVQSGGEVMTGILVNQGFGYVIAYLFLQDTGKMLLSFVTFLVIVLTGFAVRRIFLYSGNIYFNLLNRSNRVPFIIHQFLIPFIAGTFVLILLKQPRMTGLEIATSLSMILLLLPVITTGSFISDLYYDEDPRKIRIFWPWLLAALILIPAFRIIFGIGVRL